MKIRKHVAVSHDTSARLKSSTSTIAFMEKGQEAFAKLSDNVAAGEQLSRWRTEAPC
jgi:hypothetical protein